MIVEGPNAPQADMQPQVSSLSRGECWVSMQSWERVYGSFKEKGPPSSAATWIFLIPYHCGSHRGAHDFLTPLTHECFEAS